MNFLKKRAKYLLVLFTTNAMLSCGGGSDSSQPEPAPSPTPQPTNNAPVISVVNVPSSLTENSSASLSLDFSDTDSNDEHSFNWSADNAAISFSDSTAQNPTINVGDLAFNNGDIQVNLTVVDWHQYGASSFALNGATILAANGTTPFAPNRST